jgi:hypothetical protein
MKKIEINKQYLFLFKKNILSKMFKSLKIFNSKLLNKRFFSNEKIISSITQSKVCLPQFNIVEKILKGISSILLAPLGITIVQPNTILTYYTFGKFDGYRTSGLTWIPPFSKYHSTFCGDITLTHERMHLTDLSSNPIVASTFVIYNITNPVNNTINLDDEAVLSNWIENTVRNVISTYSYNELTSNTTKDLVSENLVSQINSDSKAEFYGIQAQRAGLLEINYAQEIAETMLVKQKAKATIEARKELVDASLQIIGDISEKLDSKLTTEDKSKLITCLTVSMIGNNSPSQVINLN